MRSKIGSLEIFVGPMFAGKTEAIVEKALFLQHMNRNPVIYKPRHDDRYDIHAVVSHSGARVEATAISSWPGDPASTVRAVLLEEVQFFCHPMFDGDIVEVIRRLRGNGIDVYAAGLDMDFNGRAFEVSAALMAESTKITRLTAHCATCGAAATMTGKLVSGEGRFDVGGAEAYAPFCLTHWDKNKVYLAQINSVA